MGTRDTVASEKMNMWLRTKGGDFRRFIPSTHNAKKPTFLQSKQQQRCVLFHSYPTHNVSICNFVDSTDGVFTEETVSKTCETDDCIRSNRSLFPTLAPFCSLRRCALLRSRIRLLALSLESMLKEKWRIWASGSVKWQ